MIKLTKLVKAMRGGLQYIEDIKRTNVRPAKDELACFDDLLCPTFDASLPLNSSTTISPLNTMYNNELIANIESADKFYKAKKAEYDLVFWNSLRGLVNNTNALRPEQERLAELPEKRPPDANVFLGERLFTALDCAYMPDWIHRHPMLESLGIVVIYEDLTKTIKGGFNREFY